MQRRIGQNNAQSLFGLDQVPSDPQIRYLLDLIAPEELAPPFWRVFEQLRDGDASRRIKATSAAGYAPYRQIG